MSIVRERQLLKETMIHDRARVARIRTETAGYLSEVQDLIDRASHDTVRLRLEAIKNAFNNVEFLYLRSIESGTRTKDQESAFLDGTDRHIEDTVGELRKLQDDFETFGPNLTRY